MPPGAGGDGDVVGFAPVIEGTDLPVSGIYPGGQVANPD